MNTREYLEQVENLLREGHMAPRDIQEAIERCAQHILNAGPEREAETLASLGTPEALAAEILADYRSSITSAQGSGMGWGWKLLLGLLLCPFILGAYSLVLGLVAGGAICVLAGGFSGAVGMGSLLSGGVGTLLIFVGAGCTVAGVGLLLLLGGGLLFKGSNWCMRRLFGGRRAAA